MTRDTRAALTLAGMANYFRGSSSCPTCPPSPANRAKSRALDLGALALLLLDHDYGISEDDLDRRIAAHPGLIDWTLRAAIERDQP